MQLYLGVLRNEKKRKGEKMADLTLVLVESGGYELYEGTALVNTADTIAEIGTYVVGTYGTYYNLELGVVS